MGKPRPREAGTGLKATASQWVFHMWCWTPSSPSSHGEIVSVTMRMRSLSSPRRLAKVGRARLPGRKNFSPACEIALIAATEEIYNLLRSDT